jgi:DnaK suppressor protein
LFESSQDASDDAPYKVDKVSRTIICRGSLNSKLLLNPHLQADKMNLPIKDLEAALLRQLDELAQTEDTARDASKTVELDQCTVGRLSRMDAMQHQAMSLETNRRRATHIKRIRTALAKIEEGDYGYCDDCGEPINPKRLAIDPATPFCIGCADGHQ